MHVTPTSGANELIGSKVVPRQSVGLSVAGSKAGQGVVGVQLMTTFHCLESTMNALAATSVSELVNIAVINLLPTGLQIILTCGRGPWRHV